MTLRLHTATGTRVLVEQLASVTAAADLDPFAPVVVAVPTKGVERWIAQRLGHVLGAVDGDGVCANVTFPQPSRLIREAVACATGVQPDDDPWRTGRTTWSVLQVFDREREAGWCRPLVHHLADDATPGARLALAQKVARLFAAYGMNRPQLLRDWAAGDDTDGAGGRVDADLAWQPELWRRLRDAIGTPSPAERLPAALDALRDDKTLVDLPDQLSIFGPTRLATAELQVLAALAAQRDVHLFLPHPSPALWAEVAELAPPDRPRRRNDPTAVAPRTPLVASLARDVRELQLHLTGCVPDATVGQAPPDDAEPTTLLQHLRRSIATDATPTTPVTLDSTDHTVQVHACHGAARQVEVLREVLVGLLADDATLEPRDVIVMCPNVEDYAALVSATFGLADDSDGPPSHHRHPGHRLRVRLADRSLRRTNPLLDVVATLVDLAQARVTVSELLDLAAQPPVRRRFGFDDDDLELLRDWAEKANVRWGLDAAHRAPYQLDRLPQNTWRAGLDRILLGATMAEDGLRWVDTALPLDDVDSNDVDLAGRLAELVDRIAGLVDRMQQPQPLVDWVATFMHALDLLTDTADADAWQQAQARRELADLIDAAQEHATDLPLTLGDLHALLADRLQGRATRANFRTGNLTVCSMLPMRSVPHRVVCLLGLDDGRFPRNSTPDGDDVLARDPLVGERDPRSEDRQLFLDALTAAEEHLVVLYTGADPRTNVELPPAVPVGELLDALDTIAITADGQPAREQVVVRHPLQPFDPRNFSATWLKTSGRPFSFDRVALRGAERAVDPRDDEPPFLAAALPTAPPPDDGDPEHPDDVTLDQLVAFLEHPVQAFLRQRLGVYVRDEDDEPSESLSTELKSLDKWGVGERLLTARLRGADTTTATDAEWRRGTLPPQQLGRAAIAEVVAEVDPLAAAAAPYVELPQRTLDVVAELDTVGISGRVTGTVPGVRGDSIVRVTFSRLAAKHRLRAWVQLLALTVAHPDGDWTATTIGKGGRSSNGSRSVLGPVETDLARLALADLVVLRRDGLCRPLPMPVKAAATYADQRRQRSEKVALQRARSDWENKDFGEWFDAAHALVFGEAAPFDDLLAAPAEIGAYDDETTRFGELARRVWTPLLEHEKRDEL